MKIPEEFAREFAMFPAVLRKLVEAELKSGNTILLIEHGFPAAPCGASIKLARLVNARRRKSVTGLSFYERNNSDCSGEFTTEERHFFVLEPPLPPEPVPDMDAIREAAQARQREADEALYAVQLSEQNRSRTATREIELASLDATVPLQPAAPESLIERFRESMVCDYDRWREGIGYDLELLKSATPEELVEIENLLVNRPIDDWRDVEALAALDTPRARVLLCKALKSSDPSISTAVISHAPHLVSDAERTTALVKALESAASFAGLSQTLLEVTEFHPPEIAEALLRGVLARDGGTAVHLAAMLMYIHGKADSSFDWEQRPFFLRFNTSDHVEREAVFRELCAAIGVAAEEYLGKIVRP